MAESAKRGRVLRVALTLLTLVVIVEAVLLPPNPVVGLLLPVAGAVWLGRLSNLALRGRSAEARRRIVLLIGGATFGFLLAEGVLRYGLGTYSTYGERNGHQFYRSMHPGAKPTWFHVHNAETRRERERPEFVHKRDINSLGLAEREVAVAKPDGEYRVVALGDSFTEGVGVEYDQTWVKVMEREIGAARPKLNFVTINAGISGSDICYMYVLLKHRLLTLDPDLVIVVMNNTDVDDVMLRGGLERFLPDGTTAAGPGKRKWEWLYGSSHVVRAVAHGALGLDWFLMDAEERETRQRKSIQDNMEALRGTSRLAEAHGVGFLLVLQPESGSELEQRKWETEQFSRLVDEIRRDDSLRPFDLLDHYDREGLIPEDPYELFWPIDAHHNAKGYGLMGRAIAHHILHAGLVPDPRGE